MTPAKKRIFGLIGYPVGHSLSPKMHNAAFRALKINAKYKLFPLKRSEVGLFLRSLEKRSISGLNVTIPYKELAINYIDGYKSEGAKAIGAVNTVVVGKDKRLKAFNTDYLGFNRHILELKLKPKRIAIIGAGGAARALVFALGSRGAEEICIYDVDKYKSLALFKQFNSVFPKTKILVVSTLEELETKNKGLLINATPIGMHKEDPCLVDASMLHPGIFVYDLIYNPKQTKLLKVAEESGCRFSNGLGMLLYQGAFSFKYFTGRSAPLDIMRRALDEGVKRL